MVAVLATCSKRRWNSTPLLHSSVCFIILIGMVQEGCTCTCMYNVDLLIFPQHRFIFVKQICIHAPSNVVYVLIGNLHVHVTLKKIWP